MKYYLDTNIIIYFLKGQYPEIKEKLMSTPSKNICIPSLVLAELEYGAQNSTDYEKSISLLKAFTEAFKIIPFDKEAAICYGQIRNDMKKKGSPIGSNDMLIAATAMAEGAVLVSHNTKEFLRVEGLVVEDWVE